MAQKTNPVQTLCGMGKSWCQATSLVCLDRFCRYMRNWMNGLINGQELKTLTCCWLFHSYHGMVQKIGPAPKNPDDLPGCFWSPTVRNLLEDPRFCTNLHLKFKDHQRFHKKNKKSFATTVDHRECSKGISIRREPITTACHQSNRKSTTTWGIWMRYPYRINGLVDLSTFIGKCERDTDPMGYNSCEFA